MKASPLFVRVTRHPNPLLVGLPAAVVGVDFCPFCEASRNNPMCDLLFGSGHRDWAWMSELALIDIDDNRVKENAQ